MNVEMGYKKAKELFDDILIYDVGTQGTGVGKIEGKVVFISGVVPGDIVDIEITKRRGRYSNAIVRNFKKHSDDRVKPFCKHFGVCGGCQWQHLSYEKQLFYKQKQVVDNFERIGKFDFPPINVICGADENRYYRNKLDYTFSAWKWLSPEEFVKNDAPLEENKLPGLGFHIPKAYNKVLDIEECFLQRAPSDAIRNAIRKYAKEHELSFYNFKTETGWLRNLIIKTNGEAECMVIVQFYYEDEEKRKSLLNFLVESFPDLTSIMYIVNTKRNETYYDLDVVLFYGRDYLIENLNELIFKIGPKTFFQNNTAQTIKLYDFVVDFCGLQGEEVVYDLYTGTGTIAIYVARKAKWVYGVDNVSESIDMARENAQANNVENISFYVGDTSEIVNAEFMLSNGFPDVIIADPPRVGMDKKVLEALQHSGVPKLVYVSCNPATQARDIAILDDQYEVIEVQPIDMFPQTGHLENVLLLKLRT